MVSSVSEEDFLVLGLCISTERCCGLLIAGPHQDTYKKDPATYDTTKELRCLSVREL